MDCLAHWKADQLLLPDHPGFTPEYTDYTLFSLGTAFIILLVGMLTYSITILLLKRQMNQHFRDAIWSYKLQHIVEVLNMPGMCKQQIKPGTDL